MSDAFQVNTLSQTHQQYAQVASNPQGGFAVAWQSKHDGGSGWDIYTRLYDAAGAPVGTESLVNTTTAGNQQNPALAFDSQGGLLVIWGGEGAADAAGVMARKYDAAGVADGDEFLVNVTTEGEQQLPAVAQANTSTYASNACTISAKVELRSESNT